jgi:lipopolysaccharide transport system ATP-binding protein
MGNSDVVIRVEGLGKKYSLNHQKSERYTALRDVVARQAKAAGRLLNPFTLAGQLRKVQREAAQEHKAREEEFWALKDVSFEIRRGERVGIIGRNGAGKSTLLKILSRITEPTTGRVEILGRVASLLEVGTGFHPELTGRENIFLNGAILGMSQREIRLKFDEIVDFAEVEKFLDTPVKRYSSGMYVRLAFAVAAHLEPEILVVDEVLAVGDVTFQKKCMLRMNEVGVSGRTVLFVSHNMSAIEQLCNSVITLHQGSPTKKLQDVGSAVRYYMTAAGSVENEEWQNDCRGYKNEWFNPTSFFWGDELGDNAIRIRGVNESIFIYVEGFCERADPALQVGIAVYSEDGMLLFWSYSTDDDTDWISISLGVNRLRLEVPPYLLNEGAYRIELGIALYHRMWICEPGKNAPSIRLVVRGGYLGSKYWSERRPGFLAPSLGWTRLED